jgi:hypothetical protein
MEEPAYGPRKEVTGTMTSNDQKTWETPNLTVYGDVATLTLAKNKHLGSSDGCTFNGVPISG